MNFIFYFYLKINSNSFEQYQHLNDSIIWSDDEDDEHDQSFLPIGLPPTHHRSIKATSVKSPLHAEDKSTTHDEQQDDIDIIHIRPLNNLSAFNFDCQQMNAERLTGSKSILVVFVILILIFRFFDK